MDVRGKADSGSLDADRAGNRLDHFGDEVQPLVDRPAVAVGAVVGANGYLVDQFLRDGANHRTDRYGGSIDKRLNFVTEVIEAVAGAIGIERTGIRFSPNIHSQGVDDSDPQAPFTALARRLEELRVPWIELREAHQPTLAGAIPTAPVSPAMRPLYSGKIIVNSDYDGPTAQARLDEGIADGIAFGRTFLANPDLVERIRTQAPLNQPDSSTFYWGGAEGYVDYPALPETKAA